MKFTFSTKMLLFVALTLNACNIPTTPTTPTQALPSVAPSSVPATETAPTLPVTPTSAQVVLPSLVITLGTTNQSEGITLDQGGDVDTEPVSVGDPAMEARRSGNGQALSGDGNTTPDSYLQFNVNDKQLHGGKPTTHVRIEVDYFDQGVDSFSLQYDALPSNGSDGKFAGGGAIAKSNSMMFKTATFYLCDANFANRDNGADFRIADNGDGAEMIREVRVIGLPGGSANVKVDDFGANPFDDQPDSDAIQAVLDSSCSGDTISFTSPANDPGYKGYRIDKTIFLTGMSAKHNLTFTSTDPNDHALLQATADLKGFVVRLFARTRFSNAGDIDNIDFGNIDVNGGRDVRKCLGADQIINGIDDNWGSWLPECTVAGDPWCSPGNIGMDGAVDYNDVTQNYLANPSRWTTGIVVHDLVNSQAECGTALAFGSAGGTIRNVTIDTAGDHVHASGCALTDDDGDITGWSDGITLFGPAQTVTNNTIINPSDVGIVYFGGKDTIIANNTVRVTPGNYGAFAGIALHPWSLGDVSGVQIIGNQVTSEGDTRCGGMHTGINLGHHMWGGACVGTATGAVYGNSGSCSNEPPVSGVAACTTGNCQLWAYLPSGATLTMKDNVVSGGQINYLIEGLDILGQFIDQDNVSQTPRLSDWGASKTGCNGVTWGALDKVAHHPFLPGYMDLLIHCER
jgi:parallel beta-helix repeat protein